MKTFRAVSEWCAGAAEELGDPSAAVCQLFFRWQDDLRAVDGVDLVCGLHEGSLTILLGPKFPALPIPVEVDGPRLDERGGLACFGVEPIAPGVWALTPSLNAQGLIHAFVVLYEVPSPAPWERKIIVVGA